jgi:transcription initiation factor TFIIIB Brf1 subunit/transcription initiation factor TFIIB
MEEKTVLNNCAPSTFIDRYCTKLSISKDLTKLCMFIALKVEKDNLIPENTPHSIAAGVIYFIVQLCRLDVSKKEIRNVSEISEVTINKCYKKMEKIKESLIPSSILKRYA